MEYTPSDLGSEQIVYTGGVDVMPLRGPSAQSITLVRGASRKIQWAPTDRRACDVEVRISLESYTPNPNFPAATPLPIVHYRTEYGHGKQVVTDPRRTYPGPYPSQLAASMMPARGRVMRLTAREITLDLSFYTCLNVNTGWFDVTLGVSFLPVTAMHRPMVPSQNLVLRYDSDYRAAVGDYTKFPAEAEEWKVFDINGHPFTAGAFVDLNIQAGFLASTGPFDRALYADWTPITIMQYAYGLAIPDSGDGSLYVAFR